MNRFLKPCPFCGSTNIYITYEWGRNNDTSVIFCDECKVSVKLEENDNEGCRDETERKAAEAWNRRADKAWLVATLNKSNERLEKQAYEFAKQILELKEENARLKTELEGAKTGKWKWLSCTYDRIPCEQEYECSECGHKVITHGYETPWERHCPNCGARMVNGI